MQEGGLHSRHSSHRVISMLVGVQPAMQTPLPRQGLPIIGSSGLPAQIQLPTGGTMVRNLLGFAAHLGHRPVHINIRKVAYRLEHLLQAGAITMIHCVVRGLFSLSASLGGEDLRCVHTGYVVRSLASAQRMSPWHSGTPYCMLTGHTHSSRAPAWWPPPPPPPPPPSFSWNSQNYPCALQRPDPGRAAHAPAASWHQQAAAAPPHDEALLAAISQAAEELGNPDLEHVLLAWWDAGYLACWQQQMANESDALQPGANMHKFSS